MDNQEMVCYCSNVTKGQIVKALDEGAKSLDDVRRMTGACTHGDCKNLSPRKSCCSPIIVEIIQEYQRTH